MRLPLLLASALPLLQHTLAQDPTRSPTKKCISGRCNTNWSIGFEPDFCGSANCTSSHDSQTEWRSSGSFCNDHGCLFAGDGAGSGGSGIFSDFEIADATATDSPTFTYNQTAGVKCSQFEDPPPAPPTPTYTCPAKFPNVCANARSAIEARGFSSTMIRQRSEKHHYTGSFWRNKRGSQSDDNDVGKAIPGWGLQGCNVEEYPFASGNPSTTATTRLIPVSENDMHGKDIRNFHKQWDMLKGSEANIGRPWVIEFESGVAGESTEWGLIDNAAGNICAEPYGSDFLLVGGPPKNSLQWDPYFTRQSRMRTYTTYFNDGKITKITELPPQYCTEPSPGRMTLVDGVFTSVRADGVRIGQAKVARHPEDIGHCEPWPPAARMGATNGTT